MTDAHLNDEVDFDFKYVPVEDFKQILKQVKREREKKRDEEKWQKYLKLKEEEAEKKSRLLDVCTMVKKVKMGGLSETKEWGEEEGGEDHCQPASASPNSSHSDLPSKPARQEEGEEVYPLEGEGSWEGDLPEQQQDIPVHFVQQKHRSYVRQVVESERGDEEHESCVGEDLSRVDDQCTRLRLCLEGLLAALAIPPAPHLVEEPARLAKRQVEFGARFTRNYLCELRRQMGVIRKDLSSEGLKATRAPIFYKFAPCYQTALQAFLLIEKNTPGIFITSIPPPVYEFLTCFRELCYLTNATYCDGTSVKLQEIEEMSTHMESLLRNYHIKPKQADLKKKVEAKPKVLKKKKKKDNYSMYKSTNAFEKMWKKKSKLLASSKFGSVQETPRTEKSSQSGKTDDSSSKPPRDTPVALKDIKIVTKQKPSWRKPKVAEETELKTMVETIPPEPESDSETLLKLTLEEKAIMDKIEVKPQKANAGSTEGDILDDALKSVISRLMKEVLTDMESRKAAATLAQLAAQTRQEAAAEKREVKQPSNVKLIFLKEEERQVPEEKQQELPICPENSNEKNLLSEEDRKVMEQLSAEDIEAETDKFHNNVLDYRHFFALHKDNSLYYNCTEPPWEIIHRVSEKLLDKCVYEELEKIAQACLENEDQAIQS